MERLWQGKGNVRLICMGRTFAPVPKRVMNGSEPGLDTPAAVLSGAPIDLQARTVRYACARHPFQNHKTD